jgi:hypothetical protein
MVTGNALISVLSRKEDDNPEISMYIGSVLVDVPLRLVRPFLPNDIGFQTVAPDGEFVYGKVDYENKTETGITNPDVIRKRNTAIIDVPFWSLFKGSVAYTAGDNKMELDIPAHETFKEPKANTDPTCPFASFDLNYVLYPYVEASKSRGLRVGYVGTHLLKCVLIHILFTE